MTNLLLKLFIKDYNNTSDNFVRQKYGFLSGIVGIIVNIILATIKLIIGITVNSISITADAVNNYSDAGSSAVTLIGFKIANRPADEEHPFGHGRYEYIAGLIVSFVVLIFGFDLMKTSVERIFNPVSLNFSIISVVALSVSILGKIWLAFFNKKLAKAINSPTMSAVATDCISDCAATAVTIVSLLLSHFTSINIDSYLGICVAVIIFIAGINIIKETLNPLIGQAIDKETADKIRGELMSYEGIIGMHDLIIHSYGTNNTFGSVHAEVPANCNILEIHDTIDTIEREIKRKFGIEISIHMDPLVTDDKFVDEMKEMTFHLLSEIDDNISFHDFRVVSGPIHTNFIFDVVMPHSMKYSESEFIKIISDKFTEKNENYFAVVTVDRSFVL